MFIKIKTIINKTPWEGFVKPTIKQMENRAMHNVVITEQDRVLVTEQVVQENKIRQMSIEEVNRGYVVRVGCHTFAFSTKEELVTKVMEYISEPSKTEEKWYSGNLF
jgi:hypothetical protein